MEKKLKWFWAFLFLIHLIFNGNHFHEIFFVKLISRKNFDQPYFQWTLIGWGYHKSKRGERRDGCIVKAATTTQCCKVNERLRDPDKWNYILDSITMYFLHKIWVSDFESRLHLWHWVCIDLLSHNLSAIILYNKYGDFCHCWWFEKSP